jgi:uncharacterized membrane protein YccC
VQIIAAILIILLLGILSQIPVGIWIVVLILLILQEFNN